MLSKRKLRRTFVGFRPVLGDSKDLGSGSKLCFECYQKFGDRYFPNLYLKREKLKCLGKECLLISVVKWNV